jgi:hypothetical protein
MMSCILLLYCAVIMGGPASVHSPRGGGLARAGDVLALRVERIGVPASGPKLPRSVGVAAAARRVHARRTTHDHRAVQ